MTVPSKSYMIETGMSRGRTEYTVDVEAFARDLVTALDDFAEVSLGPKGAEAVFFPDDVRPKWRAMIRLDLNHTSAGTLNMLITTGNSSTRHDGRVTCAFHVNDLSRDDAYRVTMHEMPSITVNTNRPMQAIAKDVIRRGVDMALEPATRIRAQADHNATLREMLDQQISKLHEAFPGLLMFEKMDDGLRARVHVDSRSSKPDYFYLWGSINPDGAFSFERMQNLSPEFFADLLMLIRKHYPVPKEP